MIYFRHTKLSE